MSFTITGTTFLDTVRYALADGEEWGVDVENTYDEDILVQITVNGKTVPNEWVVSANDTVSLSIPDSLINYFTFRAPSRKGSGLFTGVLIRPVFSDSGENAPGARTFILIDIDDPNYV